MRLQVWRDKTTGDYTVLQKQRTGADDGSPAYQTVQVGTGKKMEAPSGEHYIEIRIEGFSDNKPKP